LRLRFPRGLCRAGDSCTSGAASGGETCGCTSGCGQPSHNSCTGGSKASSGPSGSLHDSASGGASGYCATRGCASSTIRACRVFARSRSSGSSWATVRNTIFFRASASRGFGERSASGADYGKVSCCATAGTAHDRSANRPAAGVQSSRASGCSSAAGAIWSSDRRRNACRSRSSGARATNFSTSSAGAGWRPGRSAASTAPSRRASSNAPYAASSGRSAAAGRRSGASTSGHNPAWQPSRRSSAASRPALCSAWGEGRPDEGLHAAAAHGGVE